MLELILTYAVKRRKTEFKDAIKGLDRFVESVVAFILVRILVFLWGLLLVIPGVMKHYSYCLTPYIIADDKSIKSTDAMKKSKELMHGHRMDRFIMDLSFLGWMLLVPFTLGILSIWLIPYMQMSEAEFYRRIMNENNIITSNEDDVNIVVDNNSQSEFDNVVF